MPLPEPLTPPDLDLRDFDWMPLQVVRLRDSGIVVVASAEAFRAAVLLWCAAWHQVPAGSLPKDEKMLCSLAGFGRDVKTWRTLAADALHGFIECSDGRLYHPVIAEKAIESGSKKKKQGSRTAAATEAARLARLNRDGVRDGHRDGQEDDNEPDRNGNQERGPDRTGPDKTKPESEKRGESNSRPDLKLVEEGQPLPIDESYEPSDRAIEYAYSLGMKKADLISELSKFIALSMASRACSYNPDMSFKAWCDRWLDFKRKKDPEWKPEAQPSVDAAAIDRMSWPIVVEGTPEHIAHNIIRREQGLRPLFLCKQLAADGTIYEKAARCETLFPKEFNDFGERIAPSDAENAA